MLVIRRIGAIAIAAGFTLRDRRDLPLVRREPRPEVIRTSRYNSKSSLPSCLAGGPPNYTGACEYDGVVFTILLSGTPELLPRGQRGGNS